MNLFNFNGMGLNESMRHKKLSSVLTLIMCKSKENNLTNNTTKLNIIEIIITLLTSESEKIFSFEIGLV